MNEVAGTEGARDDRRDPFAIGCLDADLVAYMHEDLIVAHGHERKLAEVRVCRVIFQGVELSIYDKNKILIR